MNEQTMQAAQSAAVEHQSRVGNIVRATAVVAAMAAGAVACGSATSVETMTPVSATSASRTNGTEVASAPTPEDLQALKDALTVQTVDGQACVDMVEKAGGKVVTPKDGKKVIPAQSIGALEGVDPANPAKRAWSDAVDTRFLADKSDKEAMLAELQLEICENPLFGAMVANEFANMQVGDEKVVVLNPWLAQFAGPADQINDRAAEFIPLMDRDALSVTNDEAKDAIQKNYQYQDVANHLNTLLTRFQNDGNQEMGMTTFNYHLTADGLQVNGLPEISLNPDQYIANGEVSALVLELTRKPGICVAKIGFNVMDKRAEGFECEVTPQTTVPPTGGGNPTPPSATTPNHPTTPTTPNHSTPPTTPLGPKSNPHPPVSGGAPTTVEAPVPGPSTPTTSQAPEKPTTTQTTIKSTVPNTTPPGECADC